MKFAANIYDVYLTLLPLLAYLWMVKIKTVPVIGIFAITAVFLAQGSWYSGAAPEYQLGQQALVLVLAAAGLAVAKRNGGKGRRNWSFWLNVLAMVVAYVGLLPFAIAYHSSYGAPVYGTCLGATVMVLILILMTWTTITTSRPAHRPAPVRSYPAPPRERVEATYVDPRHPDDDLYGEGPDGWPTAGPRSASYPYDGPSAGPLGEAVRRAWRDPDDYRRA